MSDVAQQRPDPSPLQVVLGLESGSILGGILLGLCQFRLELLRAGLGRVARCGELDTQLAELWTREFGIASIPVSVFYQSPPIQHKLRFCFAKDDAVLLEAAEILCKI